MCYVALTYFYMCLSTPYSAVHHGTRGLRAKSNRKRKHRAVFFTLRYSRFFIVACSGVYPFVVVAATDKVAIPAISETGVVSKWSELDGGSGGSKAIERVKNRDYDGSLYMVNKPPRWNDQVRALVGSARRVRPGVLCGGKGELVPEPTEKNLRRQPGGRRRVVR